MTPPAASAAPSPPPAGSHPPAPPETTATLAAATTGAGATVGERPPAPTPPAPGHPPRPTGERPPSPPAPASRPETAQDPTRPPGRTRRIIRGLPRASAAILAGALLYLATPPVGAWPLAPLAVAILTLTVHRQPLRASYRLGVLFGLAFCLPLLRFVSFVGLDAWLVLALAEAAILGLVAPATTLVRRLPAAPLWTAAVWVAQEALRGRAPFGGFPWGRLAFTQADSPLTGLAALGGAPLLTFVVALIGALAASLALGLAPLLPAVTARRRTGHPAAGVALGRPATATGPAVAGARTDGRPSGDSHGATAGRPAGPRRLALTALGGTALTLVGLAVPLPTGAEHGTLTVAAVQGNVPADGGVHALGRAFQVTANHVAGTERLAADVAAGRRPQPDVVLWPENSSDLDPLADPTVADALDRAARTAGAPLLVGAVLDGPGPGHVRNAGMIWTADGFDGQMYVKQHPVPFAEYLPGRALLQKLITRFADEMPNDFVHGTRPGILRTAGTTLGDVICFEVAYDGLVRDTVDRGAEILVVQTNNASFGRKGESQQQLAMSRLRAVEHGRATVQVSTSGESAIINPDGTILARTGLYEAGVLSAELPRRTSRTLADRLGIVPEAVLIALGLGAMMAALISSRRTRRPGPARSSASLTSVTSSDEDRTAQDGTTRTAAGHDAGRFGTPDPTGTTPSGTAHGSATQDDVTAPDAPRVDTANMVPDQERNRVDPNRVVVCVPTYNERDNLPDTARRLRAANPTVDLLVIDDASPDGTGKIADELAEEDDHIHVLHREGKSGLGTAYIAGFSWALRHGYTVIVEMDADGSHQPEELPRLLAALEHADLVIGSRWVPGGEVRNWPRTRFLLSRGANLYVRGALGIPLRDATAGFRAYRADVLRARDLDRVVSQGYCFQVDLAWQAWRSGFRVHEVPITFVERERGNSKMSRAIVAEALWRVTWWAATTRRRGPAPTPAGPRATTPAVPAPPTDPTSTTATPTGPSADRENVTTGHAGH